MASFLMKALSLFLLLKGASSMDIQVESYECSEMPIVLEFTRICTEDNTCTTGKQSNLEANMQYYGMSDQYGLVTSSIVYLDLQMSLFAPGLEQYNAVFETSLYDFQPIELCHTSFYPQEEGSSCPSSGEYKIMSSITLPSVAGYKSWLYTGYKGTAELSIYQGSDSSSAVLGQCTLNIYTEVERDEDGNVIMANIPNGFDTLLVVLSCVAVMLLLGICVLYCSCRRRGSKVGVSQLKKLPSFTPKKFFFKPEEVDGAFKIMEEATDDETNRAWKNTPEPTRGFFNCSA